MSILSVLPLVRDYNKDKPSIFSSSKYELTQQDNQKLNAIFDAAQNINSSYQVTLKLCATSGQVYLQCRLKTLPNTRKNRLPPINSMKV